MIIDHKIIEYQGDVIFESIVSDKPQRFNYHAFNEACFIHVEKGSNVTYSSQDTTKTDEGNFTLSSSGNLIVNTMPDKGTGLHHATIIHFPKELITKSFSNELPKYLHVNQAPGGNEVITAEPCVILRNYIKGVNLFLDNQHRMNDEVMYVKIKEILLLLLQSKKGKEVSNLLVNLFSNRTVSFKATVESHLYSGIALEELAHLCNMSLSTFKRKFKEIYSDTPANYIVSRRLKKAKDLLATSDLSIIEIADATGFKSIQLLSKKFKEIFGKSPSKYRLTLTVK